jgi:hypothetical protein
VTLTLRSPAFEAGAAVPARFETAVAGHVLGEARLIGTYQR